MIEEKEIRKSTELTGIIGRESMEILSGIVDKNTWREYREIYDKASKLEIETEYPIQLDIELNSSCNLKCPMCRLSVESNENKGKQHWFKFETFKKIIEDGVKNGLKAVKLNYINEPLIRDDIAKFVEFAKKAGVCDIYFSTNGILLTEEVSKDLINAGLSRIQVSIDAFKSETYDFLRPGSNLDKVIENIEMLVKVKEKLGSIIPLVRVNFVRTEVNEPELDDFINFWKPLVDMIGIQEMVSYPESDGQLKSRTTTKKRKGGFRCSFPFKLLTINCEGNILPCCTFYGEQMIMGHIGKNDISQVWNSDNMKKLRNLHREGMYHENPTCMACVEDSLLDDS